MPPCALRGELIRKIDDCGCGSVREVYACRCDQNTKFVCVSVPLQLRGVEKYGNVPACYQCEWRQSPAIVTRDDGAPVFQPAPAAQQKERPPKVKGRHPEVRAIMQARREQ